MQSPIVTPRRRGLALPPPLWTPDCGIQLAPWMQPGSAMPLRKAGATWTPATSTASASLIGWYDGDHYQTNFDSLAIATDRSTAGKNGTQTAGGSAPTIGSGIRSRNTIEGSGSQWLKLPTSMGGSGALTVAISFRLITVPSGSFATLFSIYDGSTYGSQITVGTGVGGYANINLYFGASALGAAVGCSPTLTTSTQTIVAIYSGGASSTVGAYALYLGGALQTLSASGNLQGPGYWSGLGTPMGALLALASDGTNAADVEIRSIALWSAALTGSDITGANTYFASV